MTDLEPQARYPGIAELAPLLPDALVAVDASGRVRWANEATEALFGMPVAPVVGRDAIEFVHPDDVELVARSFESIQGKRFGTAIEVRIRAATGWKLVEVIGSDQLAHPTIGAIVLSLRDLTTRRRWEVAGDDVSRFRALVHHAATVLLLLDENGRVESVSAAITRLLGHDQELVEGRPLADFVTEADRVKVTELVASVVNAPEARQASIEASFVRRQGGEPVPMELHVVNLLDDPTVAGLVVSAHDVTELHRSLDQLAHAELELVRAERLATVGQLASMIGHELRNPLAAVTNAHYLIRQSLGTDLEPAVDKQLAMAERETERAVNLAEDLMSYVRPRRVQAVELDVASVVGLVIETTPPPDGVRVVLDVVHLVLRADEAQLVEMIANLVTNAYQAVHEGGTVTVTARRDDGHAIISVRDDGAGIRPDVVDRVFEPFLTTKVRGTGLGLPIVARLAEEHGGAVSLADHPDGGAEARLRLPLSGPILQ